MLNWFISSAHAAESAQEPSLLQGMLPFVLLIAVFYFLLIRPQNKKMKEQRAMVGALQKGDEVITSGGVVGKITKVGEEFITLSMNDKVEIKLQRQAVSTVLPKGTIKSM